MNTDLMFSSVDHTWETPPDLFAELNREFNFTLDPCCSHENHLCESYYTKEDDGLSRDWRGTAFVNPPYGRELAQWVRKCHAEAGRGITSVMLIPARTDTRWFHDYIYNQAEVRFLRGRIKFGARGVASTNSAPFPSMIVIFRGKK